MFFFFEVLLVNMCTEVAILATNTDLVTIHLQILNKSIEGKGFNSNCERAKQVHVLINLGGL